MLASIYAAAATASENIFLSKVDSEISLKELSAI